MRVDIATLVLEPGGGQSLDVFIGAVRTAQRLGFRVSTRELRDASDRPHSIIASVFLDPTTTETAPPTRAI